MPGIELISSDGREPTSVKSLSGREKHGRIDVLFVNGHRRSSTGTTGDDLSYPASLSAES
jgi:hypothetical protein